MKTIWIAANIMLSGCMTFSSDVVRELPQTTCDRMCGEHARCEEDTCICEDGFYGDPWVACDEVIPHQGWIGSPCVGDEDCDFTDGFCLTEDEGYTEGHCSQWCDLYCPDIDGTPVTLCIEPQEEDGGHCFSRCDSDLYPLTDGCRPGYACTSWPRIDTVDEFPVCVPKDWVSSNP